MGFNDRGIQGPDISFYQTLRDRNGNVIQYVNFDKMKAQGVDFVIIRAGQNTWPDPDFHHNWAEAKRVGIPRASYFFLDYRSKGKHQAELFWSLLQDDPGEGPLIVDFETGSGDWRGLWDFLVRLQELSGYPVDRLWIYTGKYYWQDFGPGRGLEFLAYGLWLAKYSNFLDLEEDVPDPWHTVQMWQRGTTIVYGPDYGANSLELDWNTFNGGWEEFQKYWNVVVPEEPEPEGGNEAMQYRVVWSNGVARRTAPHTGRTGENTYTGKIYTNGMTVEVVRDNIPDENEPTNVNKRWVEFADGLFGASEYPTSIGVPAVRMVRVEVEEPDPEPDDPQVVHTIDVFDDGKISVDGADAF